uniref:PiggyBac transposable element-derived protein domain-containing protein n=1 Tax=Phytophthora ramorum TaxID=164328 RepID=H3H887_PHYRM
MKWANTSTLATQLGYEIEKAAQEVVAVSRAAAQASKKSLERKKERLRLEKEEKRGADARAAALARLEKKKEKAATDKATKKGKRSKKTAASSTAKAKKRKTSPHEAAVDADDESEVSSPRMPSKSDEEVPSVPAQAPVGPVPSPQTRTTSRDPVVAGPASELSEVPVVTAVPVAAPMDASPTLEVTAQTRNTARALDLDEPDSTSPGDLTDVSARLSCAVDASVGMDSDVEGESSDSESWYFTHDFNDIAAVEEEDNDLEEVEEEEEEEGDSDTLEESGRNGVAIMARRRKNEAKRLARKHLKEAVEKLPRDWGKTTSNWDLLTAAEQAVQAQDTNALKEMRVTGWNLDPEMFPDDTEYPGIYDGEYGPTAEVLERATSPLDLLFFFMPRSLWTHIAKESNRYYDQHLNERVDEMHRKQREQGKDVTHDEVLEKEIKQHKPIKGHEIMRRLSDHWATTTVGAVPAGTFGRYMPKARFGRIMQNLHFSDNSDAKADTDRAWKVTPVVETMQRTFLAGYNVPPVLAFDEAVIPSRSRFNVMRQFPKDKPHKWGTKLYMTCCADTAYCL